MNEKWEEVKDGSDMGTCPNTNKTCIRLVNWIVDSNPYAISPCEGCEAQDEI